MKLVLTASVIAIVFSTIAAGVQLPDQIDNRSRSFESVLHENWTSDCYDWYNGAMVGAGVIMTIMHCTCLWMGFQRESGGIAPSLEGARRQWRLTVSMLRQFFGLCCKCCRPKA